MHCPVCRADNNEPGNCRRCRADLTVLWSLECRRQKELKAAWQSISGFNGEAALKHAALAHGLRHDRDSQNLLALAHLLRNDFQTAGRCLQAGC